MRHTLTFLFCLLSPLAACAQTQNAPRFEQPNIILLFADDAGYSDFGFHGSDAMKTPNLDKLAQEGVIFSQAYVSHPTCGPSRAGLLTGRYQHRFGYEENNVPGYMSSSSKYTGDEMGLPLDEKTIGDHLQSYGYKTAIFGKWHQGNADRFHPTKRGFDTFVGFRGGARSFFPYGENNPLDKPENRLEHGFNHYQEHEGYLTDALALEANKFIEENKDQPFFVFLSFTAVHAPMEATEEDLAQFPDLEGNRKILAAMNLAMDRASGAILDTLDDLGLSDNTLIIFTNDNGGPTDANASNNFPYSGVKSTHLEGGIRVPFVAKWPNVLKAGTTYDLPISTLDLLPTFVKAAGGDLEELSGLDGVDLMPYLTGTKSGRPHQELYWKRGVRASVRDGDWKLIRYPDRPAELYDLSKATDEQVNLAADYPDKVAELYKKIFTWESGLSRPLFMLKRQYDTSDLERMDVYRKPPKSSH